MKYLLLMALLGCTAPMIAQTGGGPGLITLHKDPRLDQLVKKHVEYNEVATRDARRLVPGYRILVVNTNDRAKAMDAKAKIYRQFPELKAYLMYQSPFFRLKVGNFREQKDAEPYLKNIRRTFSQSVYIVRDIIEVNPDQSSQD